jgi:hypothetical protein
MLKFKKYLWEKMRIFFRSYYDKLLRMQLDAPMREQRPSVNKLLAQGKIVIRNGKYTMVLSSTWPCVSIQGVVARKCSGSLLN